MPTAQNISLVEHYLLPSALFMSVSPARVQTVLGSCIAVCLYDDVKRIGGINHFMLPLWDGQGLASPKYGDIAIEKLMEKMLLAGTDKRRWVAKVFGGADQHNLQVAGLSVGARNISIAQKILFAHNIPIIAHDLGGTTGRKLIYHTHTNEVSLKYLSA